MNRAIRHIVMWRVRGDTCEARTATAHKVQAAFLGLRGRIPGMSHLEIGLDVSGVDYACDVVLVSEFTSAEALEAYASHPEHLRVRSELEGLRIARFQVDYAVEAPSLPAGGTTPLDALASGE